MLTYDEALDYLYSFVDYSASRTTRYSAQTFDLSRMWALLDSLGDPQTRYPCLHVAGTKGKGSVSALCASALKAAGYRVGLYTSPHLQDFRERIQINDEYIARESLVEIVERLQTVASQIPDVTHWELVMALAFEYYRRENVDVAVLEVGLGGRLDMTNVITPLVSVITSISYDHMALLGHTLTEIASEKAGIIKPGVPVVSSPQPPEALAVLKRMAAVQNAPLTLVGRDWFTRPVEHSLEQQTFEIWSAEEQRQIEALRAQGHVAQWKPTQLEIPLLGAHQIENAATAYVTLQAARARGLPIAADSIQSGFRDVHWPGRFEILNRHPFVVADGAHNRDSAHKLAATVREYFPNRRVGLIFGASSDKDVNGMLEELLPIAARVVLTQAVHPRAQDPEALLPQVGQAGIPAQAVPTVAQALTDALQWAAPEDVVLACGSLFVVAEIRSAWANRETIQTRG